MKKKGKIQLRKRAAVKVRRSWGRSPTLRVKESGKLYRRHKSGNALLKELDDTQGC